MTPTHRAFARAMACAVLLASAPAGAQNLLSGKVNAGTPSYVTDQNAPLLLDTSGNLRVAGSPSNSTSAAAGGIASFSRIPSSAASNNLTTAKASAGRAYTYQGCNTTASTIYLRVYNSASAGAVTVGTTAPFAGPYAFPANTCVQSTSFADAIGISASAGITYAFGTSPMDTDAAPIGAGAIVAFQIGYQ